MALMAHDAQCMALRQLESALRLYFEQEDYYSVITLAGASEEIFGKLLKDNSLGKSQNSLGSLKKAVSEIHKELYNEELSGRDVAVRANYARNKLKHWSPGDSKTVEFDAKEEAKDMLDRAIDNYYSLTQNLTPTMERFQKMHVTNNAQIRDWYPQHRKGTCP